jgi:DNA-binding protein
MRRLLLPQTDRASDRGSVELTVATPLMLLLIVLVVQLVLWAHAGQVVQTIAHQALAETRTLDATEDTGHTRAVEVAEQLRGNLLQDLDVSVIRTDSTATVEVTAQVPTMIPGLDWPVHTSQSGPVEHHIPQTGAS